MESLCDAISNFSIDLYKLNAGILNKDENLCLSPYSLSVALMLTMLGTRGTSESQLMAALKLTEFESEDVHEDSKKLYDVLNNKRDKSMKFSVANQIFGRLGLDITENYQKMSEKLYGSQMELLDFVKEPNKSTTIINRWVEEQTQHKIKNLIPDGLIDELTLLIIANAIYFEGKWRRPFDPNNNKKLHFFYSKDESIRIEMMCMCKTLKSGISSEFKCKILELSYKGDTHSMIMILPDDIDGLPALEQKLSADLKSNLYSRLTNQMTKVAIPKFKAESNFELQKWLPRLGIVDIFDDKKADFSGTFKDPQPNAYVSHVIHKSYIELTEEGTVAAAASAVVEKDRCLDRSPSPPKALEFIADHPFLFIIKENTTRAVLFVGRCTKPGDTAKQYGRRRNSSGSERSSSEDSVRTYGSSLSDSNPDRRHVRKRSGYKYSRNRRREGYCSSTHRYSDERCNRRHRSRSPYRSGDNYSHWSYSRHSSR